ncbi:MAG: PAS domain-containing protein [Desulfobacterales bacterium]|nr:PAS domain-containing protein [Deltaproteobacteria bacterium]NNL42620.1 PAS domain-containing protein [Desulfobacterales bacterium]
MDTINHSNQDLLKALSLNIAIVGGGRTCKFFLELLQTNSFPYLDINILGVCDIDPNAEGIIIAKEMGILTTSNFRDFFDFKNLDSILELTNSKDVLLELIKLRPKQVSILEHNIGGFLRSFFMMSQQLKSVEHQVILEKMSSDFLIQHSDTAIVVLTTDFKIAEANEAYLKIVGKSKENVIGGYCHEIYYGLKVPCSMARPSLKCPMMETLKTSKSAQVIHEYYDHDNRPTYSNIVTYPLKDQNGEITRIIELWRDITQEFSTQWEKRTKKLKADLNRMVQEDRMISLGKLVASCVHEINNPIQGLLVFSDLMQQIIKKDNPTKENLNEFRQHLSLMSSELERCGNIVSGLLSFSREKSLEYKNLNICDVLESVITLTRHKMELQNIQLITDLVSGIILVRGDTNRLQQCLLNLVFNAIEAMPDGGELKITSEIDEPEKAIRIKVEDTGPGISKENLDHIYDPFFTTKEEGQGTGLGLSIVYGVTKNHGGKIHVKSTVGKGTLFTLSYPVV